MTRFLSDYSGAFSPDFSHEKLSREALLKVVKENSNYLRRLDASWYVTIMKKCGNELAFECDSELWEEFINYEFDSVTQTLNICGNDLEAMMKAMQSTPWRWTHNRAYEMPEKNRAVITYRNCQTLFHLEKEGTERWSTICQVLEHRLFRLTADYFNPKIQVKALKLPPREKGSDISCQWEFTLEE